MSSGVIHKMSCELLASVLPGSCELFTKFLLAFDENLMNFLLANFR